MVAVGKDYRSDLYHRIPTTLGNQDSNGSDKDDVEVATVKQQEDTQAAWLPPVKSQMLFRLASWRMEEYKQAMLDDAFFHSVQAAFPPSPTTSGGPGQDPNPKERLTLVEEKYFVAGANARLMFDLTTEEAIQYLERAIHAASPHIEEYVRGYCCNASPDGAAHQLLARYDYAFDPFHHDVRLVSGYVVRHFAMERGPGFVQQYEKACTVDPLIYP